MSSCSVSESLDITLYVEYLSGNGRITIIGGNCVNILYLYKILKISDIHTFTDYIHMEISTRSTELRDYHCIVAACNVDSGGDQHSNIGNYDLFHC